jgi:HTH-type transcriptional regulator / antitoxin HigA
MAFGWSIITNLKEYNEALQRFDQLIPSPKGTAAHKEKMLLALLIEQYEKSQWKLPDVDPVEMIKIRMEDFGYKPADLAKAYGDKGTISKVLGYKQHLSLTMIRKFSKLLRLPADALIKEYDLRVPIVK